MAKVKEVVRCIRCNKGIAGNKHSIHNGFVFNHECLEKAKRFCADNDIDFATLTKDGIDSIRQDYLRIMRETTVLGMHRKAGKDAAMFGTQWMKDNGYAHLLES